MIHDDEVRVLIKEWRATYPGRSSFLLDYVELAGQSTDAPLAYHIFALLPVLATLVPEDTQLATGFGPLKPNLWTLIVGDSGSRKSVATNMASDLLLAINRPDLRGSEPGSEEGLFTSLEGSATQLLTYSEFGAFLSSTYEGKGQRRLGPLRERFTDLFDGKPLKIGYSDADNNREVNSHRLSLTGACSEGYLNSYTLLDDWIGGFMGRFLMVRSRVWEERPIVTGRPEGWNRLVNRLQQMDVHPTVPPSRRVLTAKAQAMLNAFAPAERIRVAEMNVGRKRYLISALNRIDIATLRVAIALSWDSGGMRNGKKPWRVSSAEMDLAIRIMKMHITSFAGIVDILAGNQNERIMGAVRLVCEQHGGVADLPTLLREVLPRQRKRDLMEIITTMEEAEELVASVDGGRYALIGTDVSDDDDFMLDDDDEE